MKLRYFVIIKEKVDDSDDGESYHYENRILFKAFDSYPEVEEYLLNNWIVDIKQA